MEEVDNIILHTLRQIGSEIEPDVASLKQLDTGGLVEGCARCINLINGNDDLPLQLPGQMSAKFRVGTNLAKACQDLGFMGNIGYNTFLYSNENECRQLLMWLVERLPKESSNESAEVLGQGALLKRKIANEFAQRMSGLWTPPLAFKDNVAWRGNPPTAWHIEGAKLTTRLATTPVALPTGAGDATAKVNPDAKKYFEKEMPLVTAQPPLTDNIPASVLETHEMTTLLAHEWESEWQKSGLSEQKYREQKLQAFKLKMSDKMRASALRAETNKKEVDMLSFLTTFEGDISNVTSSFAHREKLQFANENDPVVSEKPAATEEELRKNREEELAALEAELSGINESLQQLESDIKTFTSSSAKLSDQADEQDKENSEREEEYKTRKKVLDLLPNADENIKQLQGVVDSSAQRLVQLAEKWEEHRKSLIETYRRLKVLAVSEKDETQKQLERIKELREEMKATAEDTKAKEMLYKQLKADYEKMNKDQARSSYTRRILEIVKNISKQKTDISKVLIDTRALQKDINQLGDKLERTFAVTDELIFKDAKKDEACRKAYKYLASLHESCSTLIKTVEETGSIMREIRELEEQIETEQGKNMTANLERITKDYKKVKKENKELIGQLKG